MNYLEVLSKLDEADQSGHPPLYARREGWPKRSITMRLIPCYGVDCLGFNLIPVIIHNFINDRSNPSMRDIFASDWYLCNASGKPIKENNETFNNG